DVAARVETKAAYPGKTHASPLCEAPALDRQERRIGGEHHNDRALWLRVSRPSGERSSHRNAVHAKMAHRAIVRLDERANNERLPRVATRREDVPMPPLNPWQRIPVPPPTLPSATGPAPAPAIASSTCSALTWNASMSLSQPSYVSATTGNVKPLTYPCFTP